MRARTHPLGYPEDYDALEALLVPAEHMSSRSYAGGYALTFMVEDVGDLRAFRSRSHTGECESGRHDRGHRFPVCSRADLASGLRAKLRLEPHPRPAAQAYGEPRVLEERRRRRSTDPGPHRLAQPPPRAAVPEVVQALQRSAGNAAVARLLSRPNGRVLQRLVVCMGSPEDDQEATQDLEKSIEYLERKPIRQAGQIVGVQKTGSPRGAVISVAKGQAEPLAQLGAALQGGLTESVYILSHSEGTRVGGLTAKAIAVQLNRHLPPDFRGKIKFIACSPFAAYSSVAFYAQEVARELYELKRTAIPSVQGPGGISTIDPATGARRAYASERYSNTVRSEQRLWEAHNKPAKLAALERLDEEEKPAYVRMAATAKALKAEAQTLVGAELAASRSAAAAQVEADERRDKAWEARDAVKEALDALDATVNRPKGGADAPKQTGKAEALATRLTEAEHALELAERALDAATKHAEEADDLYAKALGAAKDRPEVAALRKESDIAGREYGRIALERQLLRTEWKGSAEEKDWHEQIRHAISQLQVSVGQAKERESHRVYGVAEGAPLIPKQPPGTVSAQPLPVVFEAEVINLPASTGTPRTQTGNTGQ